MPDNASPATQRFRPIRHDIVRDAEGIQARYGPGYDSYYPDTDAFLPWEVPIFGQISTDGQ